MSSTPTSLDASTLGSHSNALRLETAVSNVVTGVAETIAAGAEHVLHTKEVLVDRTQAASAKVADSVAAGVDRARHSKVVHIAAHPVQSAREAIHAKPFSEFKRSSSGMKRALKISLGWIFILLGIAGLFLPILQGVLFLVVGLYILSSEIEWAHRFLLKLRHRFPKIDAKIIDAEEYSRDFFHTMKHHPRRVAGRVALILATIAMTAGLMYGGYFVWTTYL